MVRPIPAKLIEDTARELMARAAIDIPPDYRAGVARAAEQLCPRDPGGVRLRPDQHPAFVQTVPLAAK